jgi:hypothetical protein
MNPYELEPDLVRALQASGSPAGLFTPDPTAEGAAQGLQPAHPMSFIDILSALARFMGNALPGRGGVVVPFERFQQAQQARQRAEMERQWLQRMRSKTQTTPPDTRGYRPVGPPLTETTDLPKWPPVPE